MKVWLPNKPNDNLARVFALAVIVYTLVCGALLLALFALARPGGDGPADSPAVEFVGTSLELLCAPAFFLAKRLLWPSARLPVPALFAVWAVNAALFGAAAATVRALMHRAARTVRV